MEAQSGAATSGQEAGERVGTSYELTLAAFIVPWRRQAMLGAGVGLAFAPLAGPWLAIAWTLGLWATDGALQTIFRRLGRSAAEADSDRALTRLSWLVAAKALVWFGPPATFTVLTHSLGGLAFVGVQAVGLTALSVSTARHSQRVFLPMAAAPVVALVVCILATLGPAQGAGALGETALVAFLLWVIATGTSQVVADWNRINARRLKALDEMRQALTRSEIAEARLSEALLHAEAGSRAKSEFLATMSHEIRTPLNGVLGMAQAMKRDDLSDVQRERLGMIASSGEALLGLLNDLLDVSKIDAGKIELEAGLVDAEGLAAGVEAFHALLADKDVRLSVSVEPQASGVWIGDPGRVRQVLHHLITNAVKFTERGEIAVTIGHDGAALVLSVADSGVGIAPARQAQVFEPFVQEDASTTRRFGGTGLGLSICRDLVTLMGGGIELSSAEGVGSTFVVRLPLRRAETQAASAAAEAPEADLPDGGVRILAAEDNLVNQAVLRTLLEATGVELSMVSNGREAVEAWASGPWDVVLMDIQMPDMDGVAATRAIRLAEAQRGLRRTPIVALTANAMNHHRQEYVAAGMDGLVPKPIDLTLLLQTLQAVLGDEDAAQDSAAAV